MLTLGVVVVEPLESMPDSVLVELEPLLSLVPEVLGAIFGLITVVSVLRFVGIPIFGSLNVGALEPELEPKLGTVAGSVFEPGVGVKLVSTLVPMGGAAIPVLLSTLGLTGNSALLPAVGLVVEVPLFVGITTCPVVGSSTGLTIVSEPLPVVGIVAVVPPFIGITTDPLLGSVIGLTTASAPLLGKVVGVGVKPVMGAGLRSGFEPCLGLPPGPGKGGLLIEPLFTQWRRGRFSG